jgi:hypothetical protein
VLPSLGYKLVQRTDAMQRLKIQMIIVNIDNTLPGYYSRHRDGEKVRKRCPEAP